MNNDLEGNSCGVIKVYNGMCLKGLRKNMNDLTEENWHSGQDFNQVLSE
jgi:hypothetical protein